MWFVSAWLTHRKHHGRALALIFASPTRAREGRLSFFGLRVLLCALLAAAFTPPRRALPTIALRTSGPIHRPSSLSSPRTIPITSLLRRRPSSWIASCRSRENCRRRMSTKEYSSCEDSSAPDVSSPANTNPNTGDAQFGPFVIPAASIFYRSPSGSSLAFVNLRPIVPGHVLVVPRRCAPLLHDLTDAEHDDLWRTVRVVQRLLRECYYPEGSGAFNVAVQDGRGAGQSVPHVHVHLLPRRSGDFSRNDQVYDALQEWAPRDDLRLSRAESGLDVPDDDRRVDRTRDEMADEAATYRAWAIRMGLL